MHLFDTIPFYIEPGRMQPPETRVHSPLHVSTPCALAIPPEVAPILAVATAGNPAGGVSGMPGSSGADRPRPNGMQAAIAACIRRGSRGRDARPLGRRSGPGRRFRGGRMVFSRLPDQRARRLRQRRTVQCDGCLCGRILALIPSFKAVRPTG